MLVCIGGGAGIFTLSRVRAEGHQMTNDKTDDPIQVMMKIIALLSFSEAY